MKNIKVEDLEFGIQKITISRPEVLNALNSETLVNLRDALVIAANSKNVRVVVLTGEGDKAFIAGADISEMKDQTVSQGITFAQRGQEVTKLLQLMPKPTIAAVNGYALGGGMEMAISCDFIVASENAIFGQPEVTLGVIPGFGATVRLSYFVGMPRAKELLFSGRKVSAQDAKDMGLANEVFPSSSFEAEVLKLAKSISRNSQYAVGVSKKLLNEFSETNGLDYKLDAEAHEFGSCFGTEEQREGMTAFLEKRKPQFFNLDKEVVS